MFLRMELGLCFLQPERDGLTWLDHSFIKYEGTEEELLAVVIGVQQLVGFLYFVGVGHWLIHVGNVVCKEILSFNC